jgi:uncharacterized alpha-E superfamily protein
MLSRYAESLYWMARYVERAENAARFVDVAGSLAIDEPERALERWRLVLAALGELERFDAMHPVTTEAAVIQYLCLEKTSPNTILSCLLAARENARGIRPVISSELWEQVNRGFLFAHRATQEEGALDVPNAFLATVKRDAHLFWGLHDGTMTHGEGWHFARLGGMIERADQIARVLAAYVGHGDLASEFVAEHEPRLGALLKSVSGFEMYRKRFGQIRDARVTAFLLLDPEFPRSVRYCLNAGFASLQAIGGSAFGGVASPSARAMGRVASAFEYAAPTPTMGETFELLSRLQEGLEAVHASLAGEFFYAEVPLRADTPRSAAPSSPPAEE